MEKNTVPISGALLVNKPTGATSHDIVYAVRRHLKGVKVGHSGTLDPFATGVLIMLIGSATRLQDELHMLPKTYRATVTLGATSDTDDGTGVIQPTRHPGLRAGIQVAATWIPGQARNDSDVPTQQQILAALETIKQQTSQIPPQYSAIKVAGKKMYEHARKGEIVETKPRQINIHSINLITYTYPNIDIEVQCSTGTYIRAIARDIGAMLEIGGYCSALERTAIGSFNIQKSMNAEDIGKKIEKDLIPLEDLVAHIPSIQFSDTNVAKLKNGGEVESVKNVPIHTSIALVDSYKKVFGIGTSKNGSAIRPYKILL